MSWKDREKLEKITPGLMAARYQDVKAYMPEILPIIDLKFRWDTELLFDVKVHMLKEGMYPCIPNWHYDLVPRSKEGQLLTHLREDPTDPKGHMWMWISDDPLPEFAVSEKGLIHGEDGEIVPCPKAKWIKFNQYDLHRGTKWDCAFTQWRLFIRAFHPELLPLHLRSEDRDVVRRHTQVYLDAAEFVW